MSLLAAISFQGPVVTLYLCFFGLKMATSCYSTLEYYTTVCCFPAFCPHLCKMTLLLVLLIPARTCLKLAQNQHLLTAKSNNSGIRGHRMIWFVKLPWPQITTPLFQHQLIEHSSEHKVEWGVQDPSWHLAMSLVCPTDPAKVLIPAKDHFQGP